MKFQYLTPFIRSVTQISVASWISWASGLSQFCNTVFDCGFGHIKLLVGTSNSSKTLLSSIPLCIHHISEVSKVFSIPCDFCCNTLPLSLYEANQQLIWHKEVLFYMHIKIIFNGRKQPPISRTIWHTGLSVEHVQMHYSFTINVCWKFNCFLNLQT
jgi:hypothetical protein